MTARVRKRTRGNKNYRKGANFEYRVKHFLEKLGYHVKRSYASKGCYDLFAVKRLDCPAHECPNNYSHTRVLWIQCKYGKKGKLKQWEIDELCKLSVYTGGIPVSAICKEPRTPIKFHDLNTGRVFKP
jgi:Holliday junction resolvase